MRQTWNSEESQFRPGGFMARFRARLSPVVGCLLAINVGVFIVILVLDRFYLFEPFAHWFALYPPMAVRGAIWQLVTYMFLHDSGGLTHILFNMYVLFAFGPHVETAMQSRRFLSLYLFSGLMAGLAHTALAYNHPVVGASGAILGVMAAFALCTFPGAGNYEDLNVIVFSDFKSHTPYLFVYLECKRV